MSYSTGKDPAIVAEEAKQLLNHPLVIEAFETIDRGLIDQMRAAPIIGNPKAEAFRDKLILSLQAVESVRNQLQGFVDTGRINESFNRE